MKLKFIQYNACLSQSGAIIGSSREKVYQELGLGFLQRQHWTDDFAYIIRFSKKPNI